MTPPSLRSSNNDETTPVVSLAHELTYDELAVPFQKTRELPNGLAMKVRRLVLPFVVLSSIGYIMVLQLGEQQSQQASTQRWGIHQSHATQHRNMVAMSSSVTIALKRRWPIPSWQRPQSKKKHCSASHILDHASS